MLAALYYQLTEKLAVPRALTTELPDGVVAQERGGAVFLQNYAAEERTVSLTNTMLDMLTGSRYVGKVTLPAYGVCVLKNND